MTKVVVIGAGLSGLFSAILAAEKGADVTLLTRGRGGLELSHGCVDIWRDGELHAGLDSLSPSHPYRKAGMDALEGAMRAFLRIVEPAGLGYIGDLHQSLKIPTAVGTFHLTNFAPRAQAPDEDIAETPTVIARIEGFRDVYPEMIRTNLEARGVPVIGIVDLPLPGPPVRDVYASDLARLFDHPGDAARVCNAWEHSLGGVSARRLLLPAVLGFRKAGAVHRETEAVLGLPVQEFPTLPPSMPGLRLERALWRAADEAGVHLVEGPMVLALPAEAQRGANVSALIAETAGGTRSFPADMVILATGGVLNGGLQTARSGMVVESVFHIPIHGVDSRSTWTRGELLAAQPFEQFGLSVGPGFRPVDEDGEVLFDNVRAVGGILAGADRISEGSRQGIDLASAYFAVEDGLG